MAQKVKVKRTTKGRVRKGSTSGGYRVCNICHGTGRVKKR